MLYTKYFSIMYNTDKYTVCFLVYTYYAKSHNTVLYKEFCKKYIIEKIKISTITRCIILTIYNSN